MAPDGGLTFINCISTTSPCVGVCGAGALHHTRDPRGRNELFVSLFLVYPAVHFTFGPTKEAEGWARAPR